MDLESLGQSLGELHHFGPRERVYAVNRWQAIMAQERLLLATSLGYVRAYPTEVIGSSIEAPVPLTFEQPLPGWPIAALGANAGEQLVLLSDGGRGLRRAVSEIPGVGLQLLNRASEEAIVATLVGGTEEELLVVTADGYGRRMPLDDVYRASKTNHPGRVLISRRPLRGAALVAGQEIAWLATTAGLAVVRSGDIPCEANTTRSHRLLRLEPGEAVLQTVEIGR
jgi:DNA gyrase/topoisomerase IV subunit A